ncbi:Uncharacterized protein Fot_08409 [Forsythia ovata]|uniref:Uncharacterized protein n=1 Tax=Forsythia ovata TaxID=205694 RepID=A0ABD1WYK6_9LAMI
MALRSSLTHSNPVSLQFRNPRFTIRNSHVNSSSDDSRQPPLRISADLAPKARFVARRTESVSVRQLQRPLIEYMSLPASQYSVLDAERIERVDDITFRCYVYRFKFFAFEVCPVLLVRVEEQPNGCCIKLLSCKLEGSPIVVAQNDKFDASMENKISCDSKQSDSQVQQLTSDAIIEVNIEIPFAFRAIPTQAIESTGSQVLEQILKAMLPRFMMQGFRKQWLAFLDKDKGILQNTAYIYGVNVVNPAMDESLLLLQKFAVDAQSGKISADRLRFGAPWRHPPKSDDLRLWAKLQLMDFVQSLINAEFGVNYLADCSLEILDDPSATALLEACSRADAPEFQKLLSVPVAAFYSGSQLSSFDVRSWVQIAGGDVCLEIAHLIFNSLSKVEDVEEFNSSGNIFPPISSKVVESQGFVGANELSLIIKPLSKSFSMIPQVGISSPHIGGTIVINLKLNFVIFHVVVALQLKIGLVMPLFISSSAEWPQYSSNFLIAWNFYELLRILCFYFNKADIGTELLISRIMRLYLAIHVLRFIAENFALVICIFVLGTGFTFILEKSKYGCQACFTYITFEEVLVNFTQSTNLKTTLGIYFAIHIGVGNDQGPHSNSQLLTKIVLYDIKMCHQEFEREQYYEALFKILGIGN